MKPGQSSVWKSVRTGVLTVVVILVFAYGFKITKVNLTELRSEQRQESLTRVIRTLARPDLFAYEQVEVIVNAPVFLPCPDEGTLAALPDPDTSGPYMIVTPACTEPEGMVQVEGIQLLPEC